jgi:hypothetical protein
MKLAELFASPTGMAGNSKPAMFDNGDLVVMTSTGEPGQIMSEPDARGCYKVKLKRTGEIIAGICGKDLELGNGVKKTA